MINLTELTVEHITNQFNNALIHGAGCLAPRNGYYYVKAFEYRSVNGKVNIPIIRANWKADQYDMFIEDAEFEIAISCLETYHLAPKIDINNLVGKTFQVSNMLMSYEDRNGKQQPKVKGNWLQLAQPGEFFNRTEAIFQLLGLDIYKSEDGNTKILTDELYGIHYEEAGVEEALDFDGDINPENDFNGEDGEDNAVVANN